MEGLLDGLWPWIDNGPTDYDHDDYFGFNNGVGCGKRKVEIPVHRFKFMNFHSICFLVFCSSTKSLVSHESHGTRRR